MRTLSKTASKPRFVSAIVAAGGQGTRMGTESTKQLIELCGIPVVVRTLLAFEKCELISEIVVAAREDELELYDEFREKYEITKLTRVVPGGGTRQESVLNAFEAINAEAEFVAIHDAARCLATPELIEKVLRSAFVNGAATAACRVSDTMKTSTPLGYIESTIDRSKLWCAGTPQVFRSDIYRCAAYTAKSEGFAATDDNSLVEHVGFPVKLVDVGTGNIKLTTPTDLSVAEVLLLHGQQ